MPGSSQMEYSLRPITQDDIPFLWEMLYYAAHMAEDGASVEAVQTDARVNIWVRGWGQPGDVGVVALDAAGTKPLGAAWLRILPQGLSTGYVDDKTPELVIAVLPECAGQGLGSALLAALVGRVKTRVPAIVLTVRHGNPARHLYERHGFVAIGEVTNRIGTKSTKMLLKLRP